jgi:phosphatidylglycerophosphatase A
MRFFLPTLLATWFLVGKAPKAPGTFGTLAALPLAYGLWLVAGGFGVLVGAAVITLLGTWASGAYMRQSGAVHDPGEIVIDEVAGILLLIGLWHLLFAPQFPVLPLHWLAGSFVMFRMFDILKPWPISLADAKVKGGFGVMFDDLLAGLYPIALFYVAHYFM